MNDMTDDAPVDAPAGELDRPAAARKTHHDFLDARRATAFLSFNFEQNT